MRFADKPPRSFRIVCARAAVDSFAFTIGERQRNETGSDRLKHSQDWVRMESRSARRSRARTPCCESDIQPHCPLSCFAISPQGIELIPVSDKMDHDVEIDVWIPDPYSTRAMRAWPHLRRREAGALHDGGNGVDSRNGRPARDDLQCAWRAQYLHGGVDRVAPFWRC